MTLRGALHRIATALITSRNRKPAKEFSCV